MHRRPLLKQLAAYAERWPEESAKVESFNQFILREAECFQRSLEVGHLTGSAWVVNPSDSHVLLTHHRKFDCWLQLGGHADGDHDIFAVALKEAQEESGIDSFETVDTGIFDIDVHRIAPRPGEPEHYHYDVRYLLRADRSTDYVVSDESHDLRWVPLNDVQKLTTEDSMLRMVRKCINRLAS